MENENALAKRLVEQAVDIINHNINVQVNELERYKKEYVKVEDVRRIVNGKGKENLP